MKIFLTVVWVVACFFVFFGAAPMGFVVFGLVPPAILWTIGLLRKLRSKRPIYYRPL